MRASAEALIRQIGCRSASTVLAVPDNAFANARLAALYDLAEHQRADLVHYKRIASEFSAGSVIDIGCGTGTLACRMANDGVDVIGVDPAQASLNIARQKPFADKVRWIHGDAATATDVVEPGSLDMAVMTGNVAQVFLGDDWHDAVAAIHQLLRVDGYFVFETRDPAYRAWEEWTKERSRSTLVSPTEGPVDIWVELVEVALPLVTFRWTYQFLNDGTELQSQSTLRFRDRNELVQSLTKAGLVIEDVRDAPDRPGKEFVFICTKG